MLFFELLGYFVFLYPLYMSVVWMIGGLIFSFRREGKADPELEDHPFFSIIIPAHDEEQIIEETVRSLRHLDYPAYEVIVVNDGSSDRTGIILDALVAEEPERLKVIHLSPNSGKAKALNTGIIFSKGTFLLTIDADCIVDRKVLKWMAWHLVKFPRVAAITGNPRVLNRTSLLGKIQVGEYSSIIGMIKRTQRILGKVLTVSGVIAAYRKSALLDCGLFDADTVTEDIDITWKLQKKFWDIRYEPRALCWVLVPETLEGLWRQRVRWAQGGVEVLKKHLNVWFRWQYRRLWPIYLEYFIGILWAYSFFFLLFTWVVLAMYYHFCQLHLVHKYCYPLIKLGDLMYFPDNPLYPRFYGAILGVACLMEFLTSFVIELRYEGKRFFKYYFWIIWYPFAYWMISALTAIVGSYNALSRRSGETVTWKSPDRGLQTLKSKTPGG
ncbi:MAG: poly-beta-1,6-N-acetyl-D-glucosamine synthase [Desulfobaccales bacterium]